MGPTPLAHRIRALVRLNGPMSLADYMALCLGDPEHGYYMAREPFGVGGDFITAPDVSQMFGELIGGWVVEVWERMGRPNPFHLVELGPGRGTLMSDLTRTARLAPGFTDAARLTLVETSPRLRARQAEALANAPLAPTWVPSVEAIPTGPMIAVSNEFFDALPIRQYQKAGGVFRERTVGLDDHGQLGFGLGAASLADAELPGPARGADEGAILEVAPIAFSIMEQLARRVVAEGGAVLAIDYGYAGPALGDTFQAVRAHAYADPLERPGEADLTAHVDFAALARAAAGVGASVHGPIEQGAFLLALGLVERAGRLGAGKAEAVQRRIVEDVTRLVAPEEMGSLFKVIAATAPGLAVPGFGGG